MDFSVRLRDGSRCEVEDVVIVVDVPLNADVNMLLSATAVVITDVVKGLGLVRLLDAGFQGSILATLPVVQAIR